VFLPVHDLPELLRLLRDEYGDPHWWPGDTPFEIAVGAILTQRASWKNAEAAISNLKKRGMLAPLALARARPSDVEEATTPSGFYKQKARSVIALAGHINEKYDGNIEGMVGRPLDEVRNELLALRGIGPETADSILLYALGMPSFVVDAYSLRLLERLGMNPGDDYDRLKARFEAALQRVVKDLADMHALIVIHCKEVCLKSPKCWECFMSDRCPSKRE